MVALDVSSCTCQRYLLLLVELAARQHLLEHLDLVVVGLHPRQRLQQHRDLVRRRLAAGDQHRDGLGAIVIGLHAVDQLDRCRPHGRVFEAVAGDGAEELARVVVGLGQRRRLVQEPSQLRGGELGRLRELRVVPATRVVARHQRGFLQHRVGAALPQQQRQADVDADGRAAVELDQEGREPGARLCVVGPLASVHAPGSGERAALLFNLELAANAVLGDVEPEKPSRGDAADVGEVSGELDLPFRPQIHGAARSGELDRPAASVVVLVDRARALIEAAAAEAAGRLRLRRDDRGGFCHRPRADHGLP